MAGGFSIKKNKISELKNFLIKKIKKINTKKQMSNNLYFDAILSPGAINENFFHDIYLLSPFGSGNAEPIFVIEKVKVVYCSVLAEKHFKLILC